MDNQELEVCYGHGSGNLVEGIEDMGHLRLQHCVLVKPGLQQLAAEYVEPGLPLRLKCYPELMLHSCCF